MTWRLAVAEVADELHVAGLDNGAHEARWLVEHVGGAPLTELADDPVPERLAARLARLVERRRAGEPLQYVMGEWSFRGHDVMVDRRVLIPRPETEVVAEVALDEAVRVGLVRRRTATSTTGRVPVADLGTGSGVLAIALLGELPEAEVWATDRSADAIAVARANIAAQGVVASRARIAEGSWFGALPAELRGRLRLIVSNPPYLAAAELAEIDDEVADWEPVEALVAGPTGLEALSTIIDESRHWLDAPGTLVCELAPHQAETLAQLALDLGYDEVVVRGDLTGRARILVARHGCPSVRGS